MNSIESIQLKIIDEFALFDDWMDKYEYIIELGKKLVPLSNSDKTNENLVIGCQSKVWLINLVQDNKIIYNADCETPFVKGIVALLIRVLSNQPASDIIKAELFFLNDIELISHLTPLRQKGLQALIVKMKFFEVME